MATSPFYPFLRRVVIENYRSIAHCDVELQPLAFLVGPNGSGKSNFLDALRFVADGMRGPLDEAIAARGDFQALLRSGSREERFTVRLELGLNESTSARYQLAVGRNAGGGPWISGESCTVWVVGSKTHSYVVDEGRLGHHSTSNAPPVPPDRPYLPVASGLPEFRPLFEALSGMAFYRISPPKMRGLQRGTVSSQLSPDGSNLARVLQTMEMMSPRVKRRIEEYLEAILPDAEAIGWRMIEGQYLLNISRSELRSGPPRELSSFQLSEGTLHALGVLTALAQGPGTGQRVFLVGIEEPETAVHPGAVGVLLDAMLEASLCKQVLVTTHSPDLLDSVEVSHDSILAVSNEAGPTTIRRIDEEGRRIMRDRLITPGEMLRMGQLHSVEAEGH